MGETATSLSTYQKPVAGVELLTPHLVDEEDWVSLIEVLPEDSRSWAGVAGVARFARLPSPEHLSEALLLLAADVNSWMRWEVSLPWPLNACVDYVRTVMMDVDDVTDGKCEALFIELAEMAKHGALGDARSWHQLQQTLANIDFDMLLANMPSGPVVPMSGTDRDLPIWKSTKSDAVPAFCVDVSVALPTEMSMFDGLVDIACRFLERGDAVAGPVAAASLTNTAAFLLSVAGGAIEADEEAGTYHLLSRHFIHDEATGYVEERLRAGTEVDAVRAKEAALAVIPSAFSKPTGIARLGLLGFFSPVEIMSGGQLNHFGCLVDKWVRFGNRASSREKLIKQIMLSDSLSLGEEQRFAIALGLNTRLAINMLIDRPTTLGPLGGAASFVGAVHAVVRADADDIYGGEIDTAIRRLLVEYSLLSIGLSQVSPTAVVQLAGYLASGKGRALILRAAHLMLGQEAVVASQLADQQSSSLTG